MSEVKEPGHLIKRQQLKLRLGPHRGFLLILVLFLAFRLMLLMAYPPEALTTYGDYRHYYNLARLSEQGYYTYLHFWYEFPPLFPYLSLGVYIIASSFSSGFHAYATLLAIVLLIFEVGNFILIYLNGCEVLGRERSQKVAWIYSCLLMPVVFWWGIFDAMTLFFTLLALYWFLKKRHSLSALALGLGIVTKYLPGLLLATVWRFSSVKRAMVYTLIALLVGLVTFAPFAVASPTYTLASLQAPLAKSSWQTVWALIDGNYSTGIFGPVADHLDPTKAGLQVHNPSKIPWFVTVPVFGLIYLYLFSRPVDTEDKKALLSFTGMTLCLFFLWSKGWSPQWQVMLIPLILLVFPNGHGALYCIVLGFVNFLEWPVILSRGLNRLLILTVPLRTLLLILMLIEFYQAMRKTRHIPPQGMDKE